jgi:hypothetical protein
MRKLITLGLTAGLLVGLMLVPGAATARKHRGKSCPRSARVDRNHDRLPDRWECRNRLSLKVNQARRDQDRDGLNNTGEFKAGTNPNDADTDNDGVRDGNDVAGTIASFDASSGTLVINLAGGGSVSGTVNARTELECKSAATAARDDSGDGDRSGSNSGPADEQGENENENENENNNACTTAALQAGRKVKEAELEATSAGAVFKKVELLI